MFKNNLSNFNIASDFNVTDNMKYKLTLALLLGPVWLIRKQEKKVGVK